MYFTSKYREAGQCRGCKAPSAIASTGRTLLPGQASPPPVHPVCFSRKAQRRLSLSPRSRPAHAESRPHGSQGRGPDALTPCTFPRSQALGRDCPVLCVFPTFSTQGLRQNTKAFLMCLGVARDCAHIKLKGSPGPLSGSELPTERARALSL